LYGAVQLQKNIQKIKLDK